MKIDVLVFGPHPDDAEIGAGGLLLKMKSLGHTTGIIDMTRGDLGWGTPEERDRECAEAAKILKLDVRENLDLGDWQIEDTFENRCKVAAALRKHRPEIVFAPYYDIPPGRGLGHNDHFKTGILVAQAFNLAHLKKAPVEGEPYQVKALFYYFLPPTVRPSFVCRHRLADAARPVLSERGAEDGKDHRRAGRKTDRRGRVDRIVEREVAEVRVRHGREGRLGGRS